MKKKINYLRHMAIFFLTLLIFSLGIFIGGGVEELRVQNLYTQLQTQDLEYQGIVTEANYIEYLLSSATDSSSCETITGAYYTSIENLEDSRLKLENYIVSAQQLEDEYFRLRDHYANVQINYWLLAEQIDDLCGSTFTTILYFYSDDEEICPSCGDQGIHLTYVKQLLKDDVLIFSFNLKEEGPIQLLAQNYDVFSTGVPVLVIEGEVHGFLTNEEILAELEQ